MKWKVIFVIKGINWMIAPLDRSGVGESSSEQSWWSYSSIGNSWGAIVQLIQLRFSKNIIKKKVIQNACFIYLLFCKFLANGHKIKSEN